MKTLILSALLAVSISATNLQAQDTNQLEDCIDIASAASIMATYRDQGVTRQTYAEAMWQKYQEGYINREMLESISRMGIIIYDTWSHRSPGEIGVSTFELCMDIDL